jgi:hypothetical protein
MIYKLNLLVNTSGVLKRAMFNPVVTWSGSELSMMRLVALT